MNSHAIRSPYNTAAARRSAPRQGATGGSRHHRRGANRIAHVVLSLLLLATAVSIATSLATASDTPSATAWGSVSVQPALTLWDLATAHPIAGLSTAATVDLILAENNLSSTVIYPGQTLLVPVDGASQGLVAVR